jgi:alpha-L-rhamnosidase
MIYESREALIRYLDFLENHSENDLVISDVEGAWCLGEWAIPLCVRAADIKLQPPFVNTYFYIRSMQRILEIARIIGKEEAVSHLHGLIERKKQALIENYYDPMSGNFADNAHSANVFALDIGLGNERTIKNLVADAKAVGRYDAGIFGIELLTKILLERGEEDLAFELLTSHHELSFRRMMEDGATTLWEHFDGSRSHNHPMFGGLVRHFFLRILGIDQPEGAGGYRDAVLLAPVFPKGLANARGSLNTPNGRIYVEWEHKYGSVVYTVDLPEGVDATLKYHDRDIRITPGKNTFFL